ncbi:MAG TPA: cytochrome P450 [Microthrixaceae bacterium]|nr:cytochrome P450 [Microthrixaceae bacterium]
MSRVPRPDGNALLDRERIKELFDLRTSVMVFTGGDLTDDPHPRWGELRESGPVHAGTMHELCGVENELYWHGLPEADRPHYSAFSFAACDEAHRNPDVFASSPGAVEYELGGFESSLLMMGGARHRRYRGLVQPSFVPAKAQWWIAKWIDETVHALIDTFVDQGEAELNVDFCAAIPVLTITGSFGIDVARALDVREHLRDPAKVAEILAPIVEARRRDPQDDLISVLTEAEITDEAGTHRLTDEEIHTFAHLLLTAGSGTTWKQMGITLAALLRRPELLEAIRADRSQLRAAIEESVRWEPTDPMFSRWVTEDTELCGTPLPKGSVLHLGLGAANRDPLRWESPDEYDPLRPLKPAMGFGGGPHICLGMHVARAEMSVGIGALLDRLPNLRLDPAADPPEVIGFYERGVMEIPVVFDRAYG